MIQVERATDCCSPRKSGTYSVDSTFIVSWILPLSLHQKGVRLSSQGLLFLRFLSMSDEHPLASPSSRPCTVAGQLRGEVEIWTVETTHTFCASDLCEVMI